MAILRRIFSPKRRALKVILALLSLALIDAVVYEPFHPVLQVHHVAVPGLPPRADGFRVVQLSDFHRCWRGSDWVIRRAARIANGTHADVAVFTGDFVSCSADNAAPCARILKEVHTRYGAYAVFGNHEYWTDAPAVCKALTASGIRVLTNGNARLPNGVSLVGMDDEWSGCPDVETAFRGLNERDMCVVLCHEPTGVKRVRDRPVLVLCGHTHGGVINIPVLVNQLARFAHCQGYVSGWYPRGRALMYVNRGTEAAFPPVRFNSRPEVTLFILHPTNARRPHVIEDRTQP